MSTNHFYKFMPETQLNNQDCSIHNKTRTGECFYVGGEGRTVTAAATGAKKNGRYTHPAADSRGSGSASVKIFGYEREISLILKQQQDIVD